MKTKTKQTFTVYHPSNWVNDLNKLLEINPPKFDYKYDYFIYIGQLPHYLMWSQYELETCATDYLPISTRLLQTRGVHGYKEYIQYLLDNNLLESDGHYIPGCKATGFRYPLKYANEKPVKTVLTKASLVKNLKKQYKNGQASTDSSTLTYDYLTKWFNKDLECDISKVDEILIKIKDEEIEEGLESTHEWVTGNKVKRRTGKRCHKQQFDPQSRYIKRYSTAIRIHDGAFDTNGVDTTTGRFHSPLVRLKRELRPTVTYGGKRLVSVDIKNSQPVLMLGLLNPKVLPYNNLSEKVYHYNPELEAYLRTTNHTYTLNYTYNSTNTSKERQYKYSERREDRGGIMLVDFISQRFHAPDVQLYIEWVTSGTFYDHFGDEIAPYLDIKKHGTKRDATKKVTYQILFGSVNNTSEPAKIFRRMFPTISEILGVTKHGDTKNRAYRTPSCALQAFEADIVLNQCCRIISEERPDLPIFTIHDCIVTVQGEEGYVKSVMEKQIEKMIGYTPTLKCEEWCEEPLSNGLG